jgi:RHS repeat-associated protein
MQLTDIRGHTVTTLDLDSNSVAGWSVYDSFGNPQTSQTNTNLINYSSYGLQERATNTSGLILMGARVYNPETNQFTSKDPIKGGNENSYTYPNDPVNMSDFTGLWDFWLNLGVTVGVMVGSVALCAVTALVSCLVAGVLVSGAGGAFVGYVEGKGENLSGWDLTWSSMKSSIEWGTAAAVGGALGAPLRTTIMSSRMAPFAKRLESIPKLNLKAKIYRSSISFATRGYFNLVDKVSDLRPPSVYTEEYLKKKYPMLEYHHGGR